MKSEPPIHDLLVAFLLVQNTLKRRSDEFFQSFGLTDAQFNILNLLAVNGGPMDQFDVTERLLVGKSSVSIVLNRMVKAGLIRRDEHLKDRRRVVLSLTPKGKKIWSKASPGYEKGVQDIFGSLARENRNSFLDELATLYSAMKKSTKGVSHDGPSLTLRETMHQLSTIT